jgi:hypothetical protein
MSQFKHPNRHPTTGDLWTLFKHRLQLTRDEDMDEVIDELVERWFRREDADQARIRLYQLADEARIEYLTARRH